ncbi:GNAT family N-acetyltransferase [Photobacterium rosenbergii]|uniref:GNAT family N-acetyltransferase n=1 Tax=Photobacterium rosenbergii TaxID=294936 RepID=A0ABU3ZD22_9GAMM|nr:GNAT family N-acetyltransferase [Photobacterium rosenbergii]MDV5168002.1 GNAT family N-acetyltransferase [Photobacterium rosenbergii]
MSITIRSVEKEDIPAIRDIYAGRNAYTGTLQLPHPSLELWRQRLEDLPSNVYSLLAEIDGKIVGQAGMAIEQNPRRRHVAGFGMAVHDDYQGKGVGTALLTELVDLAENWIGVTRIELTVYTDNAAAIALYERLGFVIEGTSRNYALRNGEYVDVYQMARLKE